MNKVLLIILINIIIIFGYKYKISLYILPFIFIIGCVLYIQLIYIKDKELVEGFNDEDVLSYWNQIEDTAEQDIKGVEDNLINKIDSVVELLTKLETSDNKYAGQQCEGEFKLTKSHKECGINAYDEYKYIISKQGDNCEYMPGYTYREEKELCKIDQECKDEGDCDKGAKCVKNKCKMGFECSSTELDNCNKKECKELNDRYGGFMYEFLDGKCTTSRCNVNEYFNCDTKDTCEGLGFNYEWDSKKLPRCQKKEEDIKTCSEIECSDNFFHIHENKNKACIRPVNEGEEETTDRFSVIVDVNGLKYIDRCNEDVCCQPSYKCGQYYHNGSSTSSTCTSNYTIDGHLKIMPLHTIPGPCVNKMGEDPYETFDLGKNQLGKIYYIWKGVDADKNVFLDSDNTRENMNCVNDNCNNCIEGEASCVCPNGSEMLGLECLSTGSNVQCKNCKKGYYLSTDRSCQQCPDRTYQTGDSFQDGECDPCPTPPYAVSNNWNCSKTTGETISVTCEAGYENVNRDGISSCSVCPAGQYSGAGESSCSPCPAGTASSSVGTSICPPCPAGQYSDTGSSNCSPCSAGQYSGAGSGRCTACTIPPYASSIVCDPTSGSLTSITCKAGYKLSGSNSSCEPCESGKYQPTDGSPARVCQPCDPIPPHALPYGVGGNECGRTSGHINNRDTQDGVRCIENYTWVPNSDNRRDRGSCVFQGCPEGYGVIDTSASPQICGICDFNKYNSTAHNKQPCQTCPTPDPDLVYPLSMGGRNSVDEGPSNQNYCDAITGFTKIKYPRTAEEGGCKFATSQRVVSQSGSDTCGLPTCRDAFEVPEIGISSRLPGGPNSNLSLTNMTYLDDNSGIFWNDGNACEYIRPSNDQQCKTFFNRNGNYCSGGFDGDCGYYIARTTGTVDSFTRCLGTSNTGNPTTDGQAACGNSNQVARCRN